MTIGRAATLDQRPRLSEALNALPTSAALSHCIRLQGLAREAGAITLPAEPIYREGVFSMFRFVRAAAALVCLATLSGASNPQEGERAPDFSVKLFDGSKMSLEDYRGKVVVINYWATWCAPCKAEMPMMSQFHERNKHRGFEIIGVVTQDSVPAYQLRTVEKLLSYPLAKSLRGDYGTVDRAVPTTYIIDRRGIIRDVQTGSYSASSFRAAVEPLL